MKFAPETPHFFKIIPDQSVPDDKLRVPEKFAHKYGDAIPNHVQLKVPNGEIWLVEFKRYDNGEVWLQNGWKQFGERYSLRYGDMVSFKYKGNGHFNIVIFDRTATEVEYPHCSNHLKDKKFQEPRKDPNFMKVKDDTIVDKSVHRSKRRERSPLSSTRTHKKAKVVSSCSVFEYEKPFFRVVMRRSYLKKHGPTMNVPFKFARTHLNESQSDIILKVVSNDKTWKVRYKLTLNKIGCLVSAKFYDGWKAFAEDNNLKINDVCLFELESGKDITLNVFIFAVEEVPN